MTGVFMRRERFEDTEKTQEEGHVNAEAETGVMLPQTKECKGLPATTKC